MTGPFRKTDAVLTIAQDNKKKTIEVTAANEVAGKIIGCPLSDLKGKNFSELVPENIAEMITDYVEFEDGANNVADVLRKVRDFKLINSDGKGQSFRLKVMRHYSEALDEFMLVLHDESTQLQTATFMEMLKDNIKGHMSLDPDTDLPDRETLKKGLEYVSLHLENLPTGACFAAIELDDYEKILAKYGIEACHKASQNVAAWCQQNLRGNDMIAQMDRNRLGIILLGVAPEPAKMVLNRLRWLIGSQQTRTDQGMDVQTSATIAFGVISKDINEDELLEKCEKALEDKPKAGTNLVLEV